MQQLHLSMRQNHHLRHGGRQQYGLFLKGIGLSLDEAMKFWRNEFMKLIDGDKVIVIILRDFKNAPFYILCLCHTNNLRMFSLSFFILLQNGP